MRSLRSYQPIVALAATGLFALTSCSGAHVLPPASPGTPMLGPAPAELGFATPAHGIVRFRIPVPGRRHSQAPHRLLPAYVSASTVKVTAIVQGQTETKPEKAQTFACKDVCTGSIVAPLGVDLLTLRLEDKKSRVLSTGTATILVFKKSSNLFNFTLDGVPKSVGLVPVPGTVAVRPASRGYVLFEARDADGNIVAPDGDYADAQGRPLVFAVRSSSKSFRLGVTTISGPGMPIPFTYNGTLHLGAVTLTPSARKGIKTTVAFHAATIKLIPGIATRISPPLSVQLLTVTQVPMPSGGTADPNSLFLVGNSGNQQVALIFNVSTGSYSLEGFNNGVQGPFSMPPIDLGGNGFSGYFAENTSSNFGIYFVVGGLSAYGGASNPCPAPFNTPIGNVSSTLFCVIFGAPSVYDATSAVIAAGGYERKMRTLNGTTYIVTANATSPSQQVYSYAGTTSTLISGAIGMGANVTSPTTGFYGDSDGTVKAIGGSTVATFSGAVEDVVGFGSSIYVEEAGRIFGASVASGIYETAPLPIGTVVEVVTGVSGAPMLVETDGTIDVMAI